MGASYSSRELQNYLSTIPENHIGKVDDEDELNLDSYVKSLGDDVGFGIQKNEPIPTVKRPKTLVQKLRTDAGEDFTFGDADFNLEDFPDIPPVKELRDKEQAEVQKKAKEPKFTFGDADLGEDDLIGDSQVIRASAEASLALATGAMSFIPAALTTIVAGFAGGGDERALEVGKQMGQDTAELLTYAPKSPEAQETVEMVGHVLETLLKPAELLGEQLQKDVKKNPLFRELGLDQFAAWMGFTMQFGAELATFGLLGKALKGAKGKLTPKEKAKIIVENMKEGKKPEDVFEEAGQAQPRIAKDEVLTPSELPLKTEVDAEIDILRRTKDALRKYEQVVVDAEGRAGLGPLTAEELAGAERAGVKTETATAEKIVKDTQKEAVETLADNGGDKIVQFAKDGKKITGKLSDAEFMEKRGWQLVEGKVSEKVVKEAHAKEIQESVKERQEYEDIREPIEEKGTVPVDVKGHEESIWKAYDKGDRTPVQIAKEQGIPLKDVEEVINLREGNPDPVKTPTENIVTKVQEKIKPEDIQPVSIEPILTPKERTLISEVDSIIKMNKAVREIFKKYEGKATKPEFKMVKSNNEVNHVAIIDGKEVSMFRDPETGWWFDSADVGKQPSKQNTLGFNKTEAIDSMIEKYGGKKPVEGKVEIEELTQMKAERDSLDPQTASKKIKQLDSEIQALEKIQEALQAGLSIKDIQEGKGATKGKVEVTGKEIPKKLLDHYQKELEATMEVIRMERELGKDRTNRTLGALRTKETRLGNKTVDMIKEHGPDLTRNERAKLREDMRKKLDEEGKLPCP